MNKLLKVIVAILFPIAVVAGIIAVAHGHNVEVLNPAGPIAAQERHLMVIAGILMLFVGIPVFVLLFAICWNYREENTKAKYTPDWDHSNILEFIWWGIPCVIILILSVITWNSSHTLDPFQALQSSKPTMTIQVVALDWKWLFIYPQQHIATVNYVEFPAGTPVKFEVTSDAPMNSFWIPQLGSQIYAMPGMMTQVNLMASNNGSYDGLSANLSGAGFANMKFTATSTSEASFNQWVASVQQGSKILDQVSYTSLSQDSTKNPVSFYASADPALYNGIIMKYMMPTAPDQTSPDMQMASMNMQGMEMQ